MLQTTDVTTCESMLLAVWLMRYLMTNQDPVSVQSTMRYLTDILIERSRFPWNIDIPWNTPPCEKANGKP